VGADRGIIELTRSCPTQRRRGSSASENEPHDTMSSRIVCGRGTRPWAYTSLALSCLLLPQLQPLQGISSADAVERQELRGVEQGQKGDENRWSAANRFR
jgi:hypothetical protein